MEETLAGESTRILAYVGVAMIIFAAAIGAIATISPRVFERVMRITDKGFSLDHLIATIERPINIERYLKPHTRLLGISALTSAICVGIQVFTLA